MEATHFHTVFTFVASPKVVPTSSVVLVLLPSRLKPVTRLTTALDGVEADGTTHIRMSPLEFMRRLAALVPRPRLHLTRFHGVLAPNAGLRAAIVPGAPQNTSVPADEHAHDAPACMGSARLLKRVFDIVLEHCAQCGGELKIIAAIEEPAVIVRILTHLGLPARASPRAPARRLPLFETA